MDVTVGNVLVDIDLADVDDDDFDKEVKRRYGHGGSPSGKSPFELYNLRNRFWQERRRAATQGGTVTTAERDFWWHTFGLDL